MPHHNTGPCWPDGLVGECDACHPKHTFDAPTCTTCHMDAAPGLPAAHDVGERLAWETQSGADLSPSTSPRARLSD